mmetsp:Transcript_7579/g.10752  ORF Transcript_7579/g.10752 Transcript_7579/m.10752 type:complete len:84 (+) Transcript_7579:519-770(+)
MSISVKHTLDCGESSSAIHSIVWEDLEAMEGQEHSVLITADRSCVQIWDLSILSAVQSIDAERLADDSSDLAEFMVVKRDPHD